MTHHKTNKYLIGIILTIALMLIIRNLGLYPVVFADEYTYSRLARLVSFSEATIPDYLYFLIYRSTKICGEGFLGCVRFLNVIFFISAAPFIFLLSKKITGEKTALLITALSILGPINTYTAYFMPESLYFLSFWVFTWLAIAIDQKPQIIHWLFLGIIFGAMTLIKPHALFLLPALVIYFFITQHTNTLSRWHRLINYTGFFLSVFATKFIIGFILAGQSGITFFGPGYSSYAANSAADPTRYIDLILAAFNNIQGHLLALAILFSVPLAHLLLSAKSVYRHTKNQHTAIHFGLYTALILLTLLVVVALFTAAAAGTGPYETMERLHMRYYNFAFPLLFITAASIFSANAAHGTRPLRMMIALPISAAILYVVYSQLDPYVPSLVDNPELRGFMLRTKIFYVLGALSFCSLILWAYATHIGAKLFVYLFLPLAVIFSTFYASRELKHHLVPNIYDQAGLFAKQSLPYAARSKLIVVGSEPAGVYRSLFYLDHLNASFEIIPKEATYDLSKLTNKEWILIIGNPLLSNHAAKPSLDGFTLIHQDLTNRQKT